MKKIRKKFRDKYFGEGKFPKRISDPFLCDDIGDFIELEIKKMYTKSQIIKAISKVFVKESIEVGDIIVEIPMDKDHEIMREIFKELNKK